MTVKDMIVKLKSMSLDELILIWMNLDDYDPEDMYDVDNNISMDDWAQAVYIELCQRRGANRQKEGV
jgi:hypothetical protein